MFIDLPFIQLTLGTITQTCENAKMDHKVDLSNAIEAGKALLNLQENQWINVDELIFRHPALNGNQIATGLTHFAELKLVSDIKIESWETKTALRFKWFRIDVGEPKESSGVDQKAAEPAQSTGAEKKRARSEEDDEEQVVPRPVKRRYKIEATDTGFRFACDEHC